MKSILKKVVVVTLVFNAFTSSANTEKTSYSKSTRLKNEVEKTIKSFKLEPAFRKKGNNMLFLNLLNLTKGEVIIKVIDGYGEIVYSESIDGEVVVEKAFNFTRANTGEYTVVVVDNYGTYKETIEIR